MSLDAQIQVRQVGYQEIVANLESIIQLSTAAFLENHEITKDAYSRTPVRYKHTFEYLFREHVADMMQEIQANGGFFFIAEDIMRKKIVAISVGRPYGQAALSHKFMESVFSSPCLFKEVLGDWWRLMEKFQVKGSDAPPARVYHQAMIAVDPAYAGRGAGTQVSLLVMKKIEEAGFSALAIETSSALSHRLVETLKRREVTIIDLDSVQNGPTKVHVVFRLQLTKQPEAATVVDWFRQKMNVTK